MPGKEDKPKTELKGNEGLQQAFAEIQQIAQELGRWRRGTPLVFSEVSGIVDRLNGLIDRYKPQVKTDLYRISQNLLLVYIIHDKELSDIGIKNKDLAEFWSAAVSTIIFLLLLGSFFDLVNGSWDKGKELLGRNVHILADHDWKRSDELVKQAEVLIKEIESRPVI